MRIEIVTECKHGQAGKHLLAEKRFDGCDQCRSGEHGRGNPHFDCSGGSRRVLEPGDLVDLIDKHTQAIIDSLGLKNLTVAPGASVVIDLGLPLDALAEGEQ